MGLAVSVGFLAENEDEEGAEWFREQMAIANRLLARSGLPSHVEAEEVPIEETRASISSFPYSFLHYLRRAAAHRRLDPEWLAERVPDGEDPGDDRAIARAGEGLGFHLLAHSDCEGFYVPVDFAEGLVDPDGELAGEVLGSSVRLLRELIEVAPAIGILLSADGTLSAEEAARVDALATDDSTPLWREVVVWLPLYEAARISVRYRTAIVFN